jgi:hypothetical protein
LFSLEADTGRDIKLAREGIWRKNTYILMLTGSSKASELAKENGSMI